MKKTLLIIILVNFYNFTFSQSIDIIGLNLNSNSIMYSHTNGYGISYNKNLENKKLGIQLSQNWNLKKYDDIYRSMSNGKIITES